MKPQFQKYIDLALALKDRPESDKLHFSFILKKRRLVSIGWNSATATHPIAHKYGYTFPFVHAELSAIVRFDGKPKELKDCVLINVRINKDGIVMLSKPCKNCLRLLSVFTFKHVYYTNHAGGFESL